jgi:hypothetical protein
MAPTCPRLRNALPRARRLRGGRLERRSQRGELVRDRLAMGWSPEPIAGPLRPQAAHQHRIRPGVHLRWIYGPLGRCERLHRYLARVKRRRGRHPRAGRREPAIPNRTPIYCSISLGVLGLHGTLATSGCLVSPGTTMRWRVFFAGLARSVSMGVWQPMARSPDGTLVTRGCLGGAGTLLVDGCLFMPWHALATVGV